MIGMGPILGVAEIFFEQNIWIGFIEASSLTSIFTAATHICIALWEEALDNPRMTKNDPKNVRIFVSSSRIALNRDMQIPRPVHLKAGNAWNAAFPFGLVSFFRMGLWKKSSFLDAAEAQSHAFISVIFYCSLWSSFEWHAILSMWNMNLWVTRN